MTLNYLFRIEKIEQDLLGLKKLGSQINRSLNVTS